MGTIKFRFYKGEKESPYKPETAECFWWDEEKRLFDNCGGDIVGCTNLVNTFYKGDGEPFKEHKDIPLINRKFVDWAIMMWAKFAPGEKVPAEEYFTHS